MSVCVFVFFCNPNNTCDVSAGELAQHIVALATTKVDFDVRHFVVGLPKPLLRGATVEKLHVKTCQQVVVS